MKTIKAAIVDDQVANIVVLKTILENECPDVQVEWTADNLTDAKQFILNKPVNAIFMDIEMPPYSSLQLLEDIPKPDFDVIFVTAHQEYALKAIKMAAFDYILKPIKPEDIIKVVDKLRKSKESKYGEITNLIKDHVNSMKENFSKIIVNVNDGYDVVDINNIILIEALDSYSKIVLPGNATYVTSRSLKDFEDMLLDKGFYRIHKSYLINFQHINKILKGVSAAVVLSNGMTIPVSARKREQFFRDIKKVISF